MYSRNAYRQHQQHPKIPSLRLATERSCRHHRSIILAKPDFQILSIATVEQDDIEITCVLSLCKGHADLLCVIPILVCAAEAILWVIPSSPVTFEVYESQIDY